MKRVLHTLALLLLTTASVMAESVITLTTDKQYGEMLALTPVPDTISVIRIDWGDGNLESYEMNPSDMAYIQRKEHKLMGQTIKIYGKLNELTCSSQEITSVRIEDQSTLKKLSLNNNLLTYETTDLGNAYGLTMLNLSQNEIGMLNLQKFPDLQYLDLYGNKELTTVVFAKDNENLKGITLYDTDLVHFYDEYNFPNLATLDMHSTSLSDVTFTPSHYPKLNNINLDGNRLTDLDVSGLTTLEKLSVAQNYLTALNVSANTKLTSLSVKGNKGLTKLNLANNSSITSLNVSSTGIKSLDVRHMSELGSLYADSLDITKLDVSDLMYLTTLSVDGCNLSYLDFTANYFNLRYLYLRGNKNFTAQSLNFMYQTIHNPNKSGRIYVSGTTGAKEADAEKYLDLDNYDSNWRIDVEGNGSASMTPVQLTLLPAKGGQYKVYRRDFSRNVENVWVKNYEEATDGKVIPGYVNVVRFTPDEGMGFRGVKINGEMVKDSLFFVTADAEIEAVFGEGNDETLDKYIAFTVNAGQDSQYGFASEEPESEILIDWGDGNLVKGTIGNNGYTYFDGQTEGSTVKVYGNVAYVNVESYPYFGVDNAIKAIDLSHNGDLRQLNLYGNQLTSIDVTNQPKLQMLNIAMNEDIEELDLTKCPDLRKLEAYTTFLDKLDLSSNTKLQYLDIKNDSFDAVNLDSCREITVLKLSNNYLADINVSNMPKLDILEIGGNSIEKLDLSANANMRELIADRNKLAALDLSGNTKLEKLNLRNNKLNGLDLSNNTLIWYVDVRNNSWNACTVNDFMNSLPEYVSPGEEAEASTTATKLWLYSNDESGTDNDLAHSETMLLNGKNWVSNLSNDFKGDGTGCDCSYVYVLPSENGEVKLIDANGEEVPSGTAVKKGTELTVVTTPDESYTENAVTVNGQSLTANKFVVTQLSDVTAKFKLTTTGIDGTQQTLATVKGAAGEIIVECDNDTEVTIVSIAGHTLHKTVVKSTSSFEVPAGIYAVTLKQGGNSTTKKLMVK